MTLDSNESTLKDLIRELIDSYKLRDGITRTRLIGSWEKIAGKYIADHTEKIYIKNKVLYLKLSSPALKHELSFARSKLIETLNKNVDQAIIEEIVFL
ncbi:MAG TPA: DUF721 domain-containing protein [Bacteroidales bacterium]|nr:DUF721 domain-containing protein [Bacteroidales bacterium]HPE58080.1 DUF721 domain-containing protein [Bacteroidales bacterium]HRX96904.1 DUF721 domain-containing protein [Bacteroidales bacterium]